MNREEDEEGEEGGVCERRASVREEEEFGEERRDVGSARLRKGRNEDE